MAPGLISDDANHSFLAIPVALGLAFVPHVLKIATIVKNHGKYDNSNPRSYVEKIKGRVPEKVWAKIKRAEAAHQNGMEGFPIFTCAILAANAAGVDNATLNKWSYVYLLTRVIYNVLYIQTESNSLSFIRTLVWYIGFTSNLMLYFNAVKLKH